MATATLHKKILYPTSDGKPMAETDYHVSLISQTLELLKDYFQHRPDVYIAANNFVYYQEGDPKKRLSPDTYVVFGISNQKRTSYKAWVEGKFPDVVFEFTSRKTRKEDTEAKLQIYQSLWRVREYFLFDPTSDYLKYSPTGYRLIGDHYQSIEIVDGRLLSEVLGFTLERSGFNLLFRDARTGLPVLRETETKLLETESKLKDANSEIELLRQQIAKLTGQSRNGH